MMKELEPTVLPAKGFPNLLVNGSKGISADMLLIFHHII